MYKYIKLMCLIYVIVSSAEAGRTSGKTSGYNRRTYYSSQVPQSTETTALTPKEFLDKKSGISTFGIISIIFVIIVSCLAFYYGIMCYPLLCREERKYRFMDVSSTITADTARSIQSIDNYPDEHKHMPIEQKSTF